MNPISWVSVAGIVVPGHGVASGVAGSRSPYPLGTIQMQKPFFKALGLDLTAFFEGTLNIDIAPATFSLERPRYTFPQVEWTSLHAPETFSFAQSRLVVGAQTYEGWVYYPHPETKERHFQNPSIIEIIVPEIAGLTYGTQVIVELNPMEVRLNHKHDVL